MAPRRGEVELETFLGAWRDSRGNSVRVEWARPYNTGGQLNVTLTNPRGKGGKKGNGEIQLNVKLSNGRFQCGHFDLDTKESHDERIVWLDIKNRGKSSIWERIVDEHRRGNSHGRQRGDRQDWDARDSRNGYQSEDGSRWSRSRRGERDVGRDSDRDGGRSGGRRADDEALDRRDRSREHRDRSRSRERSLEQRDHHDDIGFRRSVQREELRDADDSHRPRRLVRRRRGHGDRGGEGANDGDDVGCSGNFAEGDRAHSRGASRGESHARSPFDALAPHESSACGGVGEHPRISPFEVQESHGGSSGQRPDGAVLSGVATYGGPFAMQAASWPPPPPPPPPPPSEVALGVHPQATGWMPPPPLWSGGPSPGAWVPPNASAPVVPEQPPMPPPYGWRAVIEDMYRRFNPAKLEEIDSILVKYNGNEAELYRALCEKYAPVAPPGLSYPAALQQPWPQELARISIDNNGSDSESAYSFSSSEEEAKLGLVAPEPTPKEPG